jgi:hypothetical protein
MGIFTTNVYDVYISLFLIHTGDIIMDFMSFHMCFLVKFYGFLVAVIPLASFHAGTRRTEGPTKEDA